MTLSLPDQRMAWRGVDLRKDDIAFDLTRRHAAALEALLDGFHTQRPAPGPSRRELSLHVDLAQIVGLMCVRQARSGGASQYASGLAVYEEIRAKRPELLPILERGFPYHRRGEEAPGQPQITPYNIPVFSEREGRVSIFLVRDIINAAYRELKRTFTPEEIEAIDAFRATAHDLQFETRLEPGEASFLNNYTIMHARSEFEDWGDPLKN